MGAELQEYHAGGGRACAAGVKRFSQAVAAVLDHEGTLSAMPVTSSAPAVPMTGRSWPHQPLSPQSPTSLPVTETSSGADEAKGGATNQASSEDSGAGVRAC